MASFGEAAGTRVSVTVGIVSGLLIAAAITLIWMRHRSMRRKGIPELQRFTPVPLLLLPFATSVLLQMVPGMNQDSAILQVAIMIATVSSGAVLLHMYRKIDMRAFRKKSERNKRRVAIKRDIGVRGLRAIGGAPSEDTLFRSAASTRNSKYTARPSRSSSDRVEAVVRRARAKAAARRVRGDL